MNALEKKDIALITLSTAGARLALAVRRSIPESECFFHTGFPSLTASGTAHSFESIRTITADIFNRVAGLVFFAPCGVAVRSIAGLIRDKKTDPAVVVVDTGGRFAISLLSGHEGGANNLTFRIANILGAEPIITTTTEANRDLIVGVGCRRNISADDIVSAIKSALEQCRASADRVRMIASADIKSNETGLIRAAKIMNLPLRFISSEEIKNSCKSFSAQDFVQMTVGLPAVAEPAALLAGRRTTLILPRIKHRNITVAIARENIMQEDSTL